MSKNHFKLVDPHPDFPRMEEEILKFWEDNKIFEKSLERTKGDKGKNGGNGRKGGKGKKGTFVFYEGPPTANAAPGFHHVETRAFKDAIPRYQTMRGRFVKRQAGWDTHGLPVELQIEKKLGISGKKQIESLKSTARESIAYFNKLCRDSVWEFKDEWSKLTKRMGYWLDLEDPYITYENVYIEKVWGVIKQVWEKGLIYQGHKVVPYCPRCGTALSSHEVAQGYEKVTDNSVIVKFRVKGEKGLAGVKGDLYLLSWTTTPWTLPGNVALAVGKKITYVIFRISNIEYRMSKNDSKFNIPNSIFIVAKDRLSEIAPDAEVINEVKGSDLVGLEYEPLFEIKGVMGKKGAKGEKGAERAFKVYAADFVNTEEGTGIVHTAVMYGEDDYELGEEIGLPKHHTVDEDGKFTEDLKEYGLAGLSVKDARNLTPSPSPKSERVADRPGEVTNEAERKIIQYLKSNNLLFKEEKYEHDYPHCWRCGHALLYYARDSWFIEMSKLREELQKNNKEINWIPEYIKDGRFGEWLREVKDWAISRERYWGTPLPIWKCKECGEIRVIGKIGELFTPPTSPPHEGGNKGGVDLHRPYVDDIKLKCEKCGGQAQRVPEVLDVWFDSGAMPFASDPGGYPADFICEAIDQTRGWFYTLLAISTLRGKGTSYKNVICLGHVLDEKGEKMSKSKGNIINPWDVGNKYGFDIVRWYFYSVNQPGDGKLFSEKDLALMQRKVQLILWNVYNYFVTYANEAGWTPPKSPPHEGGRGGEVIDQWLNARLQLLINSVTNNLDNFDLFRSSREIEEFINELSTWYVRRNRGRSDKEFFTTLYRALIYISKVLAPFMPFISEAIYQNLNGGKGDNGENAQSVHLSSWPKFKELSDEQKEILDQMQKVREIVEQVHALRAQAGIKLRQPLGTLRVPNMEYGILNMELKQILMDEVNVKEVVEGGKLELDTTITPELEIEGLAAELTRQIQQFRKESGLQIGQMAELSYETDSDKIKNAMAVVDRNKTYLLNIEYGILNMEKAKETEVNSEKVKLFLKIPNNK